MYFTNCIVTSDNMQGIWTYEYIFNDRVVYIVIVYNTLISKTYKTVRKICTDLPY
jgi:hypothetical protein